MTTESPSGQAIDLDVYRSTGEKIGPRSRCTTGGLTGRPG